MDGHLRGALAREFPSHAAQNELATTLFLCAELKRDAGMMCRALALWEALCPAHPEYRSYVSIASSKLEKL